MYVVLGARVWVASTSAAIGIAPVAEPLVCAAMILAPVLVHVLLIELAAAKQMPMSALVKFDEEEKRSALADKSALKLLLPDGVVKLVSTLLPINVQLVEVVVY